MPRGRLRRTDGGFTMIELIVAVGLMVILLGVLAFVFRQSAEAVAQATEAVNVLQNARNVEARLGKELGSAVQYVVESAGVLQRTFLFDNDPTRRISIDDDSPAAVYRTSIEFVSQTLNKGVLDTRNVKYEFTRPAGETYGEIRRFSEALKDWQPAGDALKWADPNLYDESRLVWPVRDVVFEAAGDWTPMIAADQNTRLPAYVRASMVFLDSWGGTDFEFPMDFYFPVFQGD